MARSLWWVILVHVAVDGSDLNDSCGWLVSLRLRRDLAPGTVLKLAICCSASPFDEDYTSANNREGPFFLKQVQEYNFYWGVVQA